MEGNGMSSSMLGLELPPHPLQNQHHPNSNTNTNNNPKPNHLYQHQHQHQHMVSFNSYDADHHNQSPQSLKQNVFPYPTKPKQQQQHQITVSDEEEPGFTGDDGGGGDGKKQASSWQRVKWTDYMIKLLIKVVFYVEDDSGTDGNDVAAKKRSGGLLQKKGKWKSVSRAMMDNGLFVSPQQCEDKFNDLNKRYKRVNDILGKGTACRVVENQNLLDTMDHLSPKMKDEARKLLNSKHLFFREMCAYHNSGAMVGGGPSVGLGAHHQSSQLPEESSHHHQQHPQHCFDSGNMVAKRGSREEEEEDDDDEDDDGEEDDEDEGEHQHGGGSGGHEDEDDDPKFSSRKRPRGPSLSAPIQQLSSELMSILQDATKSPLEQRQWMRNRVMQLEEQQVSFQYEAFELEKQRLKWVKFKDEKEREMEKMKLSNERMRLEGERMVLVLRKKELELLDSHQRQCSSSKRPNHSTIAG